MHEQSASRISGRTRTVVPAMCVRALRITVLKSAGSFTRDECHDLNAEKIQRVNCFMFMRCGICCVPEIFECWRGRLGSKISGCGQLAEVAVYFPCPLSPRKRTLRAGPAMSETCHKRPLTAPQLKSFRHRGKSEDEPTTVTACRSSHWQAHRTLAAPQAEPGRRPLGTFFSERRNHLWSARGGRL